MKAQPKFGGGVDRILQPHAVRVEIKVVRTQATARKRQFRQPDLGRDEHMLRPHARPDRVEPLQPAKEQRILRPRHGAGHALVKMVMGIHETRCDDTALRLDNLTLCPKALPDLGNHAVAQQQVRARKLPPGVVHRDKVIRAADEGLCHRSHFRYARLMQSVCGRWKTGERTDLRENLSHPAWAGQSGASRQLDQ